MQPTRNSIIVPISLALVFFSAAALPLSLRSLGFDSSFGDRFRSVSGVWSQMAGVLAGGDRSLAGGYQTSLDGFDGSKPEPGPQGYENRIACLFGEVDFERETAACSSGTTDAPVKATRTRGVRNAGTCKSAARDEIAEASDDAASTARLREFGTRVADSIRLSLDAPDYFVRRLQVGSRLELARVPPEVLRNLAPAALRVLTQVESRKSPCPKSRSTLALPRDVEAEDNGTIIRRVRSFSMPGNPNSGFLETASSPLEDTTLVPRF